MKRLGAAGEKAAALFVLAVLLFNPPLLSIFSTEARVLGMPLPYLYLFGAWALVVALVALHAERVRFPSDETPRRDTVTDTHRTRSPRAPGS